MKGLNPDRKIIVGLDPGITCGIGIIDLSMKLLFFKSIRGATKGAIVKHIHQIGEPILIAVDVTQAPELARKIASSFNVTLFTPKRDMIPTEKRRLVLEYLPVVTKSLDIHTFDALAAALKAYLNYKNKFENAEARLKRLLQPKTIDTIKSELIKGVKLTHILAKELTKLEKDPKERLIKIYIHKAKNVNSHETNEKSERSKSLLRWERDKLADEVKRLKNERDKLEKCLKQKIEEDYQAIMKENRYKLKEKKIKYLQKKLDTSERIIKELQKRKDQEKTWKVDDYVPLFKISSFTSEEVDKVLNQIKKETCVLLLNAAGGGPSTAKKLAKAQPRAVIRCTKMSYQAEKELEDNSIPIIPSERLEFRYLKGIPAVKKKELEKIIGDHQRYQLESMITKTIDTTNG